MSTSRAGSSGPSSSSSSSDFQPRSTSQARSSFHTLSHTPPGATAFDPTPWNMPTPSATPAPALARPRKISVASTDATVLGSFDAVAYTSNRSTVPPYQGQFIHPPFSRLPGGFSLGTEPMSYSVMHGHPTWFLDINDYITQNAEPPGAIQYPRDLEPPRLSQQRDMILRCTFCPRTYAGVNAKSMWIRHAREKHRLVLAKGRRGGPTSSRRQSESGGSPASSTPTPGNSTRSTAASTTTAVVPRAKAGPEPKPKPAASKVSPNSNRLNATVGKIIIPARKQKAKPVPLPLPFRPATPELPAHTPWVKSLSPPPPEGIRPPRMRGADARNILRARMSLSNVDKTAMQTDSTPTQAPSTTTVSVVELTTTTAVDKAVSAADLEDEDQDEQADKEVEEMDVDISAHEDVDMEESDEECLNPPILVGGFVLPQPMFGVEPAPAGSAFTLSSRAQAPSLFSPAESPRAIASPELPVDPLPVVDGSTSGPLGLDLFTGKISSLAYLMDRNLVVSPNPPSSPPSGSVADPPPMTPADAMEDDSESTPAATLFEAMQDVFVLKMRNMDPVLKSRFMQHLKEQFGIEITVPGRGSLAGSPQIEPQQPMDEDDSDAWASLSEDIVQQMLSDRDSANSCTPLPHDELEPNYTNAEIDNALNTSVTHNFITHSKEQLQHDLDAQIQLVTGQVATELMGPLKDALTLQLTDEIVREVAGQMMDALVVQSEEAEVEWDWRMRVLDLESMSLSPPGEIVPVLSAHPLYHLFPTNSSPAPLLC